MRVISRQTLRAFSERHPQAKGALDAWYQEAKVASCKSFIEIRAMYRTADVIAGNRVIFNISGNKYRLVVKVAYKVGMIYIRFIGTHAEYDKMDDATI